ncbi:hypothetical protein EDB81DRAFT_841799 [Dactylonectria macrodidyma]|uniref:FAD/NAD(P)-binding domain-containing protein n=1 Tax=Dactylonectria macrodidyma TaxID=307937 RepID=A0A9P9JCD1_9HYPO|nr:hypothetical protein EDB81DRAFT_841799 [Dactylonectria macrodidyma]
MQISPRAAPLRKPRFGQLITYNHKEKPDFDAIIVGAGFFGCHLLYLLRASGFKCLVLDEGADLGCVWHWNCYSGAQVDSRVLIYEYSNRLLWKDWIWTQKYPGRAELCAYFAHVESKLHLKQDIIFNTRVASARWVEGKSSTDGNTWTTRLFLPKWPQGGIDYRGKRVAVIGNGSSGLQVIQELGSEVKTLTVFQRSPTCNLPMGQEDLSVEDQSHAKSTYPAKFVHRQRTIGGYPDVISDPAINREAYDFWRSEAELLAPKEPPFFYGTKRATLEQNLCEVYNQENVEIINTKANAISEIRLDGILTADGTFRDIDIIVFATGFDAMTGPLLAIDVEGVSMTLRGKCAGVIQTHLGLMASGSPNMTILCGPHGPTSFCNGPTCAELYGEWVLDTPLNMRQHGLSRIDAADGAEKIWKQAIDYIANAMLIPETDSEYKGTNIPGKLKKCINYLGGFPDNSKRINREIQDCCPLYRCRHFALH